MKTPAKKRTAAELAAAVLWCALTLGTDRLFFRYDWRTPAFFVYKALFLVLAFGLVHGAVTLVQKLRAGDKFARRWVAWTLPYLAVNLVILLIVWPGIWGNDDLAVLYLARTLQPNSWQHFLTSGAFILSLMFVPMPGGVVLVQNLLISGIVGCFAATAQDLAEKRLTRPVRPAWFALVYLPFLLPPVLMHTQQPFRTTWSTWTELFLVFMLVAMYLRGTKLNKKELAAIVILGTLAAAPAGGGRGDGAGAGGVFRLLPLQQRADGRGVAVQDDRTVLSDGGAGTGRRPRGGRRGAGRH